MSNKSFIFGSNRKRVEFCHSAVKGHVWKEAGVMTQGRREVEVGILFLSDNKNNVIPENVLGYFWCLSSKFEVKVARFRTKQLLIFWYEMQIYWRYLSLKHIYRSPIA